MWIIPGKLRCRVGSLIQKIICALACMSSVIEQQPVLRRAFLANGSEKGCRQQRWRRHIYRSLTEDGIFS